MTNSLKRRKGILLLFLIILFACVLLIGGVRVYPDTESYLKLSPNREPGYAILLYTTTKIFGKHGFFALGILQNALAAAATYLTVDSISSCYGKKPVLRLAVLFCLLMPHVITPFFASSGIVLTNAMISEGVTVSLYELYVLYLLKAIWKEEKRDRNLLIAAGFSFLLCMIRGQMLVTLIAWVIVALWLGIKEKNRKKACRSALIFMALLLLRTGAVNSYNFLVNGIYAGTTYGDITILSNVIYVSDYEDGSTIEDEVLKGLFEKIYRIAEEGHMLYQDAPEGFSGEAVFYASMHDEIKDAAIYPTLQDYAESEEGITDYMEQVMRMDSLAHSLTMELLPGCFGTWLSHYVRNVAVGLIRTVSFVHPLLNIPTLLGYLILIAAGIFLYRKDKNSLAVKLLMLAALLTAGNVAAVAMTIMCLSRYMIYNTPYIYIAAVLLTAEMIERPRIRGKENGI